MLVYAGGDEIECNIGSFRIITLSERCLKRVLTQFHAILYHVRIRHTTPIRKLSIYCLE